MVTRNNTADGRKRGTSANASDHVIQREQADRCQKITHGGNIDERAFRCIAGIIHNESQGVRTPDVFFVYTGIRRKIKRNTMNIFNRIKTGTEIQTGVDMGSPEGDRSHMSASTEDLAFFISGALDAFMKPMSQAKFDLRNHSFDKMVQYYEHRIERMIMEDEPEALRIAFTRNLKACQMAQQRMIQHQTIAKDVTDVLEELERRRHEEG